ncbi:DNA modification methylase [Erythrobacter sp. YT30]|uniref:DNA modification methylase n=1 Tax=Erythrobacter sp. YT30 TaxID=1735012 RepID=UPI00076DC7D5|nr:DNA modification methylase [Erythrobacter sp. YT30]KWV92009.1 hypothetical protein AUC45_12710 [Erythrobacter sp. YT30]
MRLIERTGDIEIPPLIDRDNRVVFGEEFVLAAKELGLQSITVVRSDRLSPNEFRLYAVNAYKVLDMGEFDEALLAEELRELEQLLGSEALTDLAFEEGELTRLLELENAIVEDNSPSAQSDGPIITRSGDLWKAGHHRFLCASSLEGSSFSLLMDGELASFGLTDMPYNLAMRDISSDPTREEFAFAHGEMSPNEFTRFQTIVMRLMKEHSNQGSLHAFFMSYHFLPELFRAGMIAFSRPKALCTWIKSQPGQGSLFRSKTEFIAYLKNGTAPHRNNVQLGKHGRNRTTAWHYDGMTSASAERDELLKLHATPKPVDLLKDAILDVTARGEIVLDPFAGIGSTAIAAESAKRRAYTIEIEPRFVDAAVRRMRSTHGIEAYRDSDGASFGDLEVEASKESAA